MKKVIAVTVAAMMVVAAQADFLINFTSGYGFSADYASDAAGNIPLLAGGEQATVQLIYAGANGVPDYLAVVGQEFQLGGKGEVYGDDIVLRTVMTAPAVSGDFFTEFGVFTDAVQLPYVGNGMVYGRVFDAAGTVYFQQAVQTMSDLDPAAKPAPTPELYQADNGTAPAFAGLQPNGDNFVVIPEPATFGLLGVAGLGLFLARKKARR